MKSERDFDEVRIPYDGLEHTFSYEVLSEKGKKSLGQKGVFIRDYSGNIAKEQGQYTYKVITSHNRYERTIELIFIIEQKLQPEMIFEPNGAIDYIDGEYYKYKFTTEYRSPTACKRVPSYST